MPRCSAVIVLLVGFGSRLAAQTAPPVPLAPRRSHLEGKWQAKTGDEVRNIMGRNGRRPPSAPGIDAAGGAQGASRIFATRQPSGVLRKRITWRRRVSRCAPPPAGTNVYAVRTAA